MEHSYKNLIDISNKIGANFETHDMYKKEKEDRQKEKTFITKDSGQREEFESGMVRDTQDDKPRFDLIPPLALKRVAELYGRGAVKYTPFNWAKGSPFSRFYASAFRHLMQYAMGDKSEDHLSAVCFNVLSIIHLEEVGRKDLDDMPQWENIKK